MKLVIIGMKHCGKSTIGRLLSSYWQMSFIDSDDLIMQRYAQNYGEELNCRAIFQQHGNDFFRALEVETIQDFHNSPHIGSYILALGGGAPMNREIKNELKKLGKIIYLQNEPEVLFKRIEKKGFPPYIDVSCPFESFMKFYQEREKVYQELADITIYTGNIPPKETAMQVAKILERELRQ